MIVGGFFAVKKGAARGLASRAEGKPDSADHATASTSASAAWSAIRAARTRIPSGEFTRPSWQIARAGCAAAKPGEWVRYSTPGEDGAEYVAICLPAFAPGIVHRDD